MKDTVLITGGGGDLAWSILRSLRASSLPLRIVGAECSPDAIGGEFYDEFYLLPPASAPDYRLALESVCRHEGIRLIYPASDAELPVLANLRKWLLGRTDSHIVVHPLEIVDLLRDKVATNRFLVHKGLPAPETLALESADDEAVKEFVTRRGCPLVVKPAISRGSRGMHLVDSLEEIQFYRTRLCRPILQEYIGPPESEHTCGVYICADGEVRVIVLRRKLFGGVTGVAERVEAGEITNYCRLVAEALGVKGPLNIQIRTGQRGPLLFEINPRFSSTACIRARFGFNDVLWALEETLFNRVSPYQRTDDSFCFRYLQEYYCCSQGRRLPKRLDVTQGPNNG